MHDIMYIKNYFNGIQEVRNFSHNNVCTNALAALKILSYFTVIIPLAVGVCYGLSNLIGRVSYPHLSSNTQQVEKIADSINNKSSPIPDTIDGLRAEIQKIDHHLRVSKANSEIQKTRLQACLDALMPLLMPQNKAPKAATLSELIEMATIRWKYFSSEADYVDREIQSLKLCLDQLTTPLDAGSTSSHCTRISLVLARIYHHQSSEEKEQYLQLARQYCIKKKENFATPMQFYQSLKVESLSTALAIFDCEVDLGYFQSNSAEIKDIYEVFKDLLRENTEEKSKIKQLIVLGQTLCKRRVQYADEVSKRLQLMLLTLYDEVSDGDLIDWEELKLKYLVRPNSFKDSWLSVSLLEKQLLIRSNIQSVVRLEKAIMRYAPPSSSKKNR